MKEMSEIDQALTQVAEGITWKAPVTNKQSNVRLLVVVAMTLMTPRCGQDGITYYFVPVLNSIGITKTTQT